MTESEWPVSEDPVAMLAYLCEVTGSVYGHPTEYDRKPSDRKLRLFACACRRQIPSLTWDGQSQSWRDMEDRPEELVRANGLPDGGPIPAIDHAMLFVGEERPFGTDVALTLPMAAD